MSTPKRPSFSLQFGKEQNTLAHSFERRAYWLVLKATRVSPIPTLAKQAEDGEHFVNGQLTLNLYLRDTLEDKSMFFTQFDVI